MKKNVIIIGAPRSGTSMTALIFTRKGYFVTDDEENELQKASEFNPNGFWEASGLRDGNEELFNMVGFPYANTWLFEPINNEQANKIADIEPLANHKQLVEHYDSNTPWMWKDPNLCFTIGYWWKLMDPEKTGVLFLRRDPKEIYQSFLRLKWSNSDRQSKNIALRRIKHHMDYAEQVMKKHKIPYLAVNYSEYATATDKAAKRISEYFGVELSSADIGYNKKYKTSGVRGRVMRLFDRISELIPDSLRKSLKKIMPKFLMKILFPMRYTK